MADELPNRPSYIILGPTAFQPWAGAYIGITAGYGWGTSSVTYTPNDVASYLGTCGGVGKGQCIPSSDFLLDGATAGGRVGYDWQINPMWLVGVVADYQWADLSQGGASPFHLGNVGNTNMVINETIKSFGTLRVRMGVVPANPWLLYATGGLAYGQISSNSTVLNPLVAGTGSLSSGGFSYSCSAGGPACFAGSASDSRWGWSVGGGFEVHLTNNLTWSSEILYLGLGQPTNTAFAKGTVAGTSPSSIAVSFPVQMFFVARGGLNFRF